MGYCGPRGIAHEGQFLTWSQSDRDKAIWWYLRDRAECSKCGTRDEEWTGADGRIRHAYYAAIMNCEGCAERERGEEAEELQNGRGKSIVLLANPEAD